MKMRHTLVWSVLIAMAGCRDGNVRLGTSATDYSFPMTKGYYLAASSDTTVVVLTPNYEAAIQPRVTHIAWNRDSIVARQEKLVQVFKDGRPPSVKEQFWILDLRNTNMPHTLGPFSEEEFAVQKESFSSSTNLTLRPVRSYLAEKGIR